MDPTRSSSYTGIRKEIADLVPEGARSILDIGCSNGALGAWLKRGRPDRRVVGLEFDPGFCAEATSRLDRALRADLNESAWPAALTGEQFDCIVAADLLEHLVDPGGSLAIACGFLRPGGHVVISVPNIRHIVALHRIFWKGRFPREPRGLFDSTHLRWFTYDDLIDLLVATGLVAETSSFNLRVTDDGRGTLNRIVRKIPRRLQGLAPVREFLAYQFCVRAVKPGAGAP